MLKHTALALLLSGFAFAQGQIVTEYLDEVRKVTCESGVPKGFACAIVLDVSPHFFGGIGIASVVGGESNSLHASPPPVIREVSLILNGTLYTAVYDPPLKRDDKFYDLRRNIGIPARVDGDDLFIQCPDGKRAKAKIIRREKIDSGPQPA